MPTSRIGPSQSVSGDDEPREEGRTPGSLDDELILPGVHWQERTSERKCALPCQHCEFYFGASGDPNYKSVMWPVAW